MDKNDDDGYPITVSILLGCISQGSTWDEALEIIGEAITGYIENLILLKKPVPIEVAVQLKDPFSV